MAKIAPRSEFLQLEGIQLDSLCRLCGNMNINLIPVIAEDGQETELLQKIVTHLKILVNPEDVLPKKLCIHCTNTLVSWHSFYESCRETNEKFHAMISCAKNGGIVEVSEDLQPEVLPEDGEEAEMDEYIEFLDKEDCEDENVDLLNEEEEHLLPGEEDLGDARLIQMDVQEVQEVQGDVCMEEVIKEELLEEEIFEGEDFRAKEGSEGEEIPGMEAPEECKAQRKEKFQEEEKTRRRKRLRREFRQEKSINENLPEGEFPGEASKGKTQEENVQEEKLTKIIKIERDLNEDLLPEGEFHEELNEQDHPEEEYLEDDERPEEQINKISEEAQNLMEEESQESPEKKFNQIQGLPEVEFQEEEEEDLSVKEFSEEDAKNAPGSKFLEFPELPERELKPATKSRENKSNDAFLCEMCHQIFTREYNLMKHITTHTEDHPCCVCCLSFPTNAALKAHGKNHTREEVREAENCRWVIKCESCSEKFTSTYHLYRHERSSHDTGKMYPCSQCHEVLPSGTLLRIHERRHQVFPCDVCDKVLRSQLALREHQFSHTGEQPYSCQECGKRFRYSTSLLEHQKTHRGVRKYKCSHCDKSFTRSNMLKEHERVHTKERPYRCHICPAKFTQSNSLKKHIRTAHISCKNCGQYFGDDLDEVLHRCRGEK